MKIAAALLAAGLLAFGAGARAHPGSGLVLDRAGNVYFVDTGSGVWKISRDGTLTRVEGPAYHWMAIDRDDRLAKVTLPYFASGGATVARAGTSPTLILSSDFPVAVGPDGSLYYPWSEDDAVRIFRLEPSGKRSVLKTLPSARSASGEIRWRNGLVAAPDGSIYYSEDRAVRRIKPGGEIVTIAESIAVSGCGKVPGAEPHLGPYCRGLDVDSAGAVYVAAAGCASVLKIAPDGMVSTVLKAESPWSPTSVAVAGSEVYVLEYTHTPGDDRREWIPRVRRISSDGRVTTAATVERR